MQLRKLMQIFSAQNNFLSYELKYQQVSRVRERERERDSILLGCCKFLWIFNDVHFILYHCIAIDHLLSSIISSERGCTVESLVSSFQLTRLAALSFDLFAFTSRHQTCLHPLTAESKKFSPSMYGFPKRIGATCFGFVFVWLLF